MFTVSRRLFPVYHWLLTLFLGPVFVLIYDWLQYPNGEGPDFLMLLYYWPLSVWLLFPISVAYFIVALFPERRKINVVKLKIILDIVLILGVCITIRVVAGFVETFIVLPYSIAAIIVSLAFRIRVTPQSDSVIH